MTRSEILAELRSKLSDSVAPYHWSDDRLMRFLALGQTQFCRDTGFFRDSTNYTLSLEVGVTSYAIPSEVIQVLSLVDIPYVWATHNDTGQIELSDAPTEASTVQLRVWRAARTAFDHCTSGLYDGEMEIPTDFHLAPIEWTAAEAFGDHDSERQDPVKAADHKRNYQALVKEGKRVFRLRHGLRNEFAPNPLYLV